MKKPYVTTARAKGVRPLRLLLKYPVRLALNPFISSVGGLFPHLVSGGAIVAMVLSLPMVGPTLVDALVAEDVYLAGSLLMLLSLLGVVLGTLVSDLLLLWLDPRIRSRQRHDLKAGAASMSCVKRRRCHGLRVRPAAVRWVPDEARFFIAT